jgi:hypothetical protein
MYQFLFIFLFSFSSYGQLSYERAVTQHLCSPKLQGRGYVNGGDSLAAIYIASEFQKLGIQPYESDYFQSFSFEVNTFPNAMQVELNGNTLKPGVDYIVDPASGTGNYNAPMRILSAKDIFKDTFLKYVDSCKNGLIIPVIDPATTKNSDTLKIIKGLAHELAATICPVVLLQKEKFTWSVAQNQYKFPFIVIQDSIFQGNTIEIQIDAQLKTHQANNVIAYLPATKRCKKTIVISAHYDHLGKMGQETYFPGGNDNASGTAMLLSIAKELKGNNPFISYIFIAFAGEEAGLLGSHYYVQHPLFPLKKIDFLLNLDIMGSGEEGITAVNATVFPKIFDQLNKINEEKHYVTVIKKRGKAANSDHYWFTENKVPSFFFYTMGPNKHYHDVYDTYEELSFSAFNSIKQLILDFVRTAKF